ncbi:NmrA/HSCARG family protein [Aspergillus lucknowensis]|uniref:NmrA-like domain-containing protein n=1 Tax=Aspergillus lucknowensis TaxID=176173 RepID=A0ABR4M2Z8_9EURO
MSSKLVVFGATGQQGSSIITTVLTHPTLSKRYSVRGITRNVAHPKALSLAARAKSIELVEADLDDPSTLPAALKNAHTVILITETIYAADLKEREARQGKAVADAAVAAGAEFFIFSTAAHASKLWDGGPVDQFDSKAEVEEYIRGLRFKQSAFIAPGMFMQNLTRGMAPRKQDDGSYAIIGVNDPHVKIPLIETVADTGLYVVPLLKDPEGMNGRVMHAATGLYSFSEIAEIISRVSGETVKYVQIAGEVYAGFMKEEQGARMVSMMRFVDNPGYYGPRTEELVRETVELVEGKLTTVEEFAQENFTQL